MTAERDLLEVAIGPEPPSALDFEAIEARAKRTIRRRNRLALAGTAAAVVAVAVGGVTVLPHSGGPASGPAAAPGQIVYRSPTTDEIAYCYRSADIVSTAIDQHVPVGINGDGPAGRGDVASVIVQICTDAWKNDHYGWQKPGLPRVVPPLVACILTGKATGGVWPGAVGVFPGTEQTCADLGLPVAKL